MINSSTPGALQKASSGSAMATKPGAVASGTGRATGSGVAAGGIASVGMAGKEAPKAKPEVDGDSGCLGCLAVFGGITAFFYTLCARHEAAYVSSSLASIFFLFHLAKNPSIWTLLSKHLDLSRAPEAELLLCHINQLSLSPRLGLNARRRPRS